jgi:hypothetical protein
MEKPPSRAKRSERQFCSQDCYLSWNEKHQQSQEGRRERMREKETAVCEICEYSRFVEMAHIVPRKDGGTFHKNNIAFLCPNHHRLLDHRGIKMNELEKLEEKIRKAVCDGDGWEIQDSEKADLHEE